ncbi:hypothetical protein DFAR_3630014 [Desulfarculales bacterium]
MARDLTVSLAGRLYKAPVPLIGKQIILLYHDHDQNCVEVLLEGRSHGLLRPLDLAVNCRVKRDHHLLRLAAPFSSQSQIQGSAIHEPSHRAFFALTGRLSALAWHPKKECRRPRFSAWPNASNTPSALAH